MSLLHSKCPYLHPNDRISLYADLYLTNDTLNDGSLNVQHKLLPTGRHIVALLVDGSKYKKLIEYASAESIHINVVAELLGFLNHIGCLNITRSQSKFKNIQRYLLGLMVGYVPPSVRHRYKFSIKSLLIASIKSTQLLLYALLAVAGMVFAMGVTSLAGSLILSIFTYLVFTISIVAHEYAHYIVLGRYKITPVIIQYPNILQLLHPRLNVLPELLTAVAGPLVGIIFCVIMWRLCVVSGHEILAYVSLLVSFFHLSSFTPWTSDGRAIFHNIK